MSLNCEAGTEGAVVKRRGGLAEVASICDGAVGLRALRRTRTGSQSGAWMMKRRKWAPSTLLELSCPSR